jgi:geranylgeranyl pyrophosphate synthase
MTAHKTGVLARLSTKLTCVSLNINEEMSEKISKFAEKIGVAF